MTINARNLKLWILGTCIFIGLPLLAWGIGDLAGFFADSARLLYVIITPPLHAALTFWFTGPSTM